MTLLKVLFYLLVPVAAAVVVFVAWLFYFKPGSAYSPPETEIFPFKQLTVNTPVNGQVEFTDSPRVGVARGTLLVDHAHRNILLPGELTQLISRVADRGFAVEYLDPPDRNSTTRSSAALNAKLAEASSLLIVSPYQSFNREEVFAVQKFLERGGRVLVVAEPSRPNDVNSIAGPLGLEFQPDYLFNSVDYDLNFQNIIVRQFQPHEITSGLDEIILHSTGTVTSAGSGLAFTDENTESSLYGKGTGASPIATGENRNVVGVYDLTFMVPPNNLVADNNRLVSNLADFLTGSQREFELANFPDFFEGNVDIVLGNSSLISQGTSLRHSLGKLQVNAQLREEEDLAADTVFLGLFDHAEQVAVYLEANGIRVDGEISLPGASGVSREKTAVVALFQTGDRQVLLILGDTAKTVSSAISKVTAGTLQQGLVNDSVGVYKTQ